MPYVSLKTLARKPRWTPYQAVQYAIGEVQHEDKYYAHMCDHFVAWCYGYGGSGYYAASTHWYATPNGLKYAAYREAPAGAFVFYDIGAYGHVTLSVGHGKVASNDVVYWGQISVVESDYIAQHWGARPLGWTPPYLPGAWGENPHDPGPPWPVPAVDVSRLRLAAWGPLHSSYPAGTSIVQKALHKEGLLLSYTVGRYGDFTRSAYAHYQRRLGYTGGDANGIPGATSLARLGQKYGFTVS